MTSKQFKDIITRIKNIPIYHNKALKSAEDYIVWAETGISRFNADAHTAETAGRFAVDCYTKDEYSEIPSEIERVLEDGGAVITDYAVDYENDTGYTHYAYTVEV